MTSKVPQGDIGIADTWLNPPPHQRKFLGKEARVPYSRKMRRLVVCYEPLHPLFIHFEFDHSIVRFNLEPPVWPYEFGGRDQYLVVAAASQDRSGKVTFHFDHGHQSPLLDRDAWESIHRSPAWAYLQPKIMEWHDLRESRRVDRISKQDILRSLCPPNDISNPTIEHEILQELKNVSRLRVADVLRKLKHFDEQCVRTAIAQLIVNCKIHVDTNQRYSMTSDLSMKEVDE